MPKRLFDRLTLFGRARLDVTIPTGPVRPTQRRYAVNLLDMSDPPCFRDEAVVALHELLNLGVRGHCMLSLAKTSSDLLRSIEIRQSVHRPKTPSLVGARATGSVRPSALHGHTGVAMEDGSGRPGR